MNWQNLPDNPQAKRMEEKSQERMAEDRTPKNSIQT